MGAMKELMIEMWNARAIPIEAFFLCPTCGQPAAAYLSMPGDADDHAEEVSCLNPDARHMWTVEVRRERDGYVARLEDHHDVDVRMRVYDNSDDWDEPLPEPGAFEIFFRSLDEWRSNLTELGTPYGESSRNRMLFTTLFSILEAYLSDAVIGAALAEGPVRRRMLTINQLKEKKVSLQEVNDNPNIVSHNMKRVLQGISFHNLTAVDEICKIAFPAKILPLDETEKSLVMESVSKRHDCVHRNGFDKDGDMQSDITKAYLSKLSKAFEAIAVRLDTAIRDALVERFFEKPI